MVPGSSTETTPMSVLSAMATAVSVGTALGGVRAGRPRPELVSQSPRATARPPNSVPSDHRGRQRALRHPSCPQPRLGKEFDAVAAAFNTMAQRLGVRSTHSRRQMLADLGARDPHPGRPSLEAYLEALEDGVQRLDQDTVEHARATRPAA